METNNLYNIDCIKGMKTFPDNYFDLAIVDPPYMENINEYMGMQKRMGGVAKTKTYQNVEFFKKPDKEYFIELKRISKNQIIFGVNHYEYFFGCGRIIWDKNVTGQYNHAEIAYQSTSNSIRIFKYTWNGMLQENMKDKEQRIHPTQKPIQLYKWILRNYAQPNFKIIDTHVGSGSSIIAFIDFKCEWIGFEIDKDYYDGAMKRIKIHKQQMKLF